MRCYTTISKTAAYRDSSILAVDSKHSSKIVINYYIEKIIVTVLMLDIEDAPVVLVYIPGNLYTLKDTSCFR